MYSQKVRRVMAREAMLLVEPETTVRAAAQAMNSHSTSAALVVSGDALLGIFTEHDALCRVLAAGLDPAHTPLAEVMSPDPHTVGPDNSYGHALQLMHEHGLRHLPVVEAGRVVGMVRARDALDPEMEEFSSEAQRREGYAREGLHKP